MDMTLLKKIGLIVLVIVGYQVLKNKVPAVGAYLP